LEAFAANNMSMKLFNAGRVDRADVENPTFPAGKLGSSRFALFIRAERKPITYIRLRRCLCTKSRYLASAFIISETFLRLLLLSRSFARGGSVPLFNFRRNSAARLGRDTHAAFDFRPRQLPERASLPKLPNQLGGCVFCRAIYDIIDNDDDDDDDDDDGLRVITARFVLSGAE
jgi:hypothetical protein